MAAYRSDLEAALHRVERLETQLDRIEEERAKLEAELSEPYPPPSRHRRWLALGALAGLATIAVHVGIALASDRPDSPRRAPAPGPSEVEAAAPAPVMSSDETFYGQYWPARVESDSSGRFLEGEDCVVMVSPGAYNGAGIATVQCGDVVLHNTTVSPPRVGDDSGFCSLREEGQLDCMPAGVDRRRGCWLSTSRHRATCEGTVDLYITTVAARDPRVRPPPAWVTPPRPLTN